MTATSDQPGPSGPLPPEARDRAVDVLTHSYANDQLTEEQLETLLDRVYRATTLAELQSLIGNLPVPQAVGGEGGSTELAGQASSALASPPVRVRALLSGHERKVTGVVPRRLELRARLGYVEMDLTHATFEPGVTEIDARAHMGYVEIRLPGDVQVENDGGAIFGYFALKGSGSPETVRSDRVVRITGRAIMGYAECHISSRGTDHQ
jgi:hypothetical protein